MTRAPAGAAIDPAAPIAGDLAVLREHRLVGDEHALVGIEQLDIVEQHRRLGLGVEEAMAIRRAPPSAVAASWKSRIALTLPS